VQTVTRHDRDTAPDTPDLDALVRRHQAGLWRFARALGAQPAEAEDLVQEAFIAAHRRAAEVPSGPAAAGWLRRAVRDRFVDRRRAAARQDRLLLRHAEQLERSWTEADDADDGGPWLDALRRCLDRLDGRARAILDACYRDGLSRDEMGAAFGLRPGSVKSRLQRIRGALRACVEERLGAAPAAPTTDACGDRIVRGDPHV
jgi:RNA polymerase sigma-70 factor (ECF subfamily)